MAYELHNFRDGDVVNAKEMNEIDQEVYKIQQLEIDVQGKQDKLRAGANIQIKDGVISATGGGGGTSGGGTSGGGTHGSEYVTPEDYGAYGDGIHDDAPALTAAIYSRMPVVLTQDLYIKSSVFISDVDVYIDGMNHTLHVDFNNVMDAPDCFFFKASKQVSAPERVPEYDEKYPLCNVTSNLVAYGDSSYTESHVGPGQGDFYNWGYCSYKKDTPITFTDIPMKYILKPGETEPKYEYAYYDAHSIVLRDFTVEVQNSPGRVPFYIVQMTFGEISNVRVICLDNDCSTAFITLRSFGIRFINCMAELISPQSSATIFGNQGYAFCTGGDNCTVRDCMSINCKDSCCISGSREEWSTNSYFSGFRVISSVEDKWNIDGFNRQMACIGTHAAVLGAVIEDVMISINNYTGDSIHVLELRCPFLTCRSWKVKVTHADGSTYEKQESGGGMDILFFEFAHEAIFEDCYMPGVSMYVANRWTPWTTYNYFNKLILNDSVVWRLADCNGPIDIYLTNSVVKQYIEKVQNLWLVNSTVENRVGDWGSVIAITAAPKGEIWLTNSTVYGNPSEWASATQPIIDCDENKLHAVNSRFFYRNCDKITNHEQQELVNCKSYDMMRLRIGISPLGKYKLY